MKITIFGAGYVGLSLAVMLASKNHISLVEVDKTKFNLLRDGTTYTNEQYLQKEFLKRKKNINLSCEWINTVDVSEYFIICLPSDFNETRAAFDTKVIEVTIDMIASHNKKCSIIIKSTLPLGFTESQKAKYPFISFFYIPEFSREGSALYDNYNPDRIVIGSEKTDSEVEKMLILPTNCKSSNVIRCSINEAEAIKLFSNAYLAMRVCFFNEADNFAIQNNLNMEKLLSGICSDTRIGNIYNNPSFGFGGYCLPKDTKQLTSLFDDTPGDLIKAINQSNLSRKHFVAKQIIEKSPSSVGIYKIEMKTGANNSRASAILDIIQILLANDIKVTIFEDEIKGEPISGATFETDFTRFVEENELIISNSIDKRIKPFSFKLFSRDIFSRS